MPLFQMRPASAALADVPFPAAAHLPGGGEGGADVGGAQLGEARDQEQHALQTLHVHAPGLGALLME